MSAPVRLFVFGLGYAGAAFARAMKGHVQWIGGTTRSADAAKAFAAEGFRPFVFDGKAPGAGVAEAVRLATHVVVAVPPGDVDPVLDRHRMSLAAAELRHLVYLSTVGVYGNYGGAWVSEATTPHPAPGRSTARLAAETAWTAFAAERDLPLAIFRIAGIYGPGRNALQSLADGSAHRVVKPGQVFNRIHVDDLTAALAAALHRDAAGLFNVSDDEPAPPQDVVAFAAELMGVKPPPEVPLRLAVLSPMARSFYAECKRVRNARLREQLGVTLRYPTYREGLTALWKTGQWRALPRSPVRSG